MDAGTVMNVTGVVVRGRADASQWVSKFSIQWSVDGGSWNYMPGHWTGVEDEKVSAFQSPVRARFVKIVVQKWTRHISMRAGILVKACHDCSCRSGTGSSCATCVSPWHRIFDNHCGSCNPGYILVGGKCQGLVVDPPETARRYSTLHSAAVCQQSMLSSSGAWCTTTNKAGQFMIIDSGALSNIRGVVTRDRADARQFVKKFALKWSREGKTWYDIPGSYDAGDGEKVTVFPAAVHGRFVKIIVHQWHSHISMRAGLLLKACPECKCSTGLGTSCAGCVPETHRTVENQCSTCNPGYIHDGSTCKGLVVDPPASWRSYSTLHSAAICQQPTLGATGAWCTTRNRAGEYMIMDAGRVSNITGVVTKGRGNAKQWVKTFNVQWSTDGMQWNPIPGTWDGGEAQKVSVFTPAVQARYVKLIVQTWHSHISMRAGLLIQACHNCKCETGKGGACATCVSPWHRTTANQCATCNPGHILAAGKCEGKILNPPESQRSYSS